MRKLLDIVRTLGNKLDLRDYHVYGGILLVGIGTGCIYWQLAPVVVGLFLIYIALRRA